jgi:O-antigen/teichoic acid export membrane protein
LALLVGSSLLQITVHVGLSLVLLWKGYGAMGVVSSALVSAGLSGAFLWCGLLSQRGLRWGGKVHAAVRNQILTSTARVFAGSFVGYLSRCLDNLLVAGILGPAAMSFYGMAWSASRIPVWILSQALGLVLVPTLAPARSDAERMERIGLESLRYSYLLMAPACALLFVAADSLVVIVLGVTWLPVVPALRVMSVTALLGPLVIVSNGLLVATDRGHLTSFASGAQLIVLLLTVAPLAAWWGVPGAALGDLVATAALAATLIALCRRSEPGVNCWGMSPILLPVLAAVSAGLLALIVSAELSAGPARLASEVSLSVAGYMAIVCLLGGRGRLMELALVMRDITCPPAAAAAAPADTGSDGIR